MKHLDAIIKYWHFFKQTGPLHGWNVFCLFWREEERRHRYVVPKRGVYVNGQPLPSGKNITVRGSKVYVNGAEWTPGAAAAAASKTRMKITIEVAAGVGVGSLNMEGDDAVTVENISVAGSVSGSVATGNGSVTIQGNSGGINTMSGDVRVTGNVVGSVSSMSGNITAKEVSGYASSMSGNVSGKKAAGGASSAAAAQKTPTPLKLLGYFGIVTAKDYHRWSLRNHPDKVSSSDRERAAKVFKVVSNAARQAKLC